MRISRWLPPGIALLGAAAIFAVGLILGRVGMSLDDSIVPAERGDSPVLISPTTHTELDSRDAALVLTWSDPDELRLGFTHEGVVTEVLAEPGEVLRDGSPVVRLGPELVLGYASPRPFGRPLALDSVGADVEQLSEFLVRLGHLGETDIDQRFDWAIGQAVKAFNESRDVANADTSFDLGTVIWLGDSEFVVGHVETDAVGSRAREDSLLARGEISLLSADLEDESVTRGLDGVSLIVETESDVQELRLDGPKLVGDMARAVELLGLTPTDERIEITIRRSEPTVFTKVPASSVVFDDDGRSCVFDSSGAPILVEISGGEFGSAFLTDELVGTQIISNPQASLNDPTCG